MYSIRTSGSMESRILNVGAVRTAPASMHFVSARGNGEFVAGYPKLVTENSIRSLQYSIPAVQHHYGNAFAPDDGDEDECDSFVHNAFGDAGLHSNEEQYYNEDDEDDEDVDEDVEMSPAVEVISIDPNCDYDSEEEDEEEEEKEDIVVQHPVVIDQHDVLNQVVIMEGTQVAIEDCRLEQISSIVSEAVIEEIGAQELAERDVIDSLESDDIEPELQNLHRDSDEENSDNESSDSSSASSSSSSSSSSNSSCSSRNNKNHSRSSSSTNNSSRTTSTASSHPSDYVPHSDRDSVDMDHQENLARVIERRKMIAIERRKRINSINRKSFSLPHSPVTSGNTSLVQEMTTSLSFEDLDMSTIVNELSPLKAVVHAIESDDRLVSEMAENNFDLAAYITEDDFVTTDSADSNRNRRKKTPLKQKSSPEKKQPKSRGKQIQMLRELMISPKRDKQDMGTIKRSCTNNARRIVENSASETEESEVEADSSACNKIFGGERMIGKQKHKEDDIKADPTWNPNGIIATKTVAQKTGQKTTTPTVVNSPAHQPVKIEISDTKSQSSKGVDANKTTNSLSNKTKLLNAGSQLSRSKMLSMMAKNKIPTHSLKQKSAHGSNNKKIAEKERQEQPKKKAIPVTNVKLDHDYCSPKKGQKLQPIPPIRKAIEIPFLLPTMDQLRQKKKLSKNKKQTEASSGGMKHKTGEHCDNKIQNTEISKSLSESSNSTGSIVPCEAIDADVKESCPMPKSPTTTQQVIQPQPAPQQKQISLLKINQNKSNGLQTAVDCSNNSIDEIIKQECQSSNADSSCSNENLIRVKKKLNLQEYKKRREFPMDDMAVVSIPLTESSSKSSISSISVKSESSAKEELVNTSPVVENHQQHSVKLEDINYQQKSQSRTPLDPISAAKLKALRMQQLKREAAIKSTEAKIIPKTVPQIVPLAEITSIKFDEHGNPMPYDKNAEKDEVNQKLHDNYEEIVVVSMGCNTDVTINPRELCEEITKNKKPGPERHPDKTLKNELPSDVTDTIKRIQSSGSAIISSSSLISSIQEVVIKKKSTNKTELPAVASLVEKRNIGGGLANQQGSPDIGISPPNAFSPGKPEKAGGSYDHSPSFDYEDGQLQQTAHNVKPLEHGEDKIIMHLRKDRQRTMGTSIAIQTVALERFPELKKLSAVRKERTVSRSSCGSAVRNRFSAERDHKRSRRQYRRRRSRSSSSEAEVRKRSSSSYRAGSQRSSSRRSRSRCSSLRRTRSRSYRHRSRSDSRRRRSSVSSERRRYRDRDYSRRCRSSRRRQSRSTSSSSSYTSSCSSRSRSSRSRSHSSRISSRARNISRNEYRKPAAFSPERKIVYVGRLEAALKREDLKRKFMQYGRIKQVTLHYKDSGAKYGFVTFEKPQDAYKAIDSSSKDPNLVDYDVSFGGRRAFCRTEYADLDGDLSQDQDMMPYFAPDGTVLMPPVAPLPTLTRKDEAESFEDMLKKLKKEISAKKPSRKS